MSCIYIYKPRSIILYPLISHIVSHMPSYIYIATLKKIEKWDHLETPNSEIFFGMAIYSIFHNIYCHKVWILWTHDSFMLSVNGKHDSFMLSVIPWKRCSPSVNYFSFYGRSMFHLMYPYGYPLVN